MPKTTRLELLFDRIDFPEGCWEWKGSRYPRGYGRIRDETGRIVRAHRFMWEAINGPIIGPLGVLHKCDNPPCVRPDHLYLGDQRQNGRDREVRGRNPKAKLNPELVRLMRDAYDSGWTIARLSRQFGVNQATVHAVVHRTAWLHVT